MKCKNCGAELSGNEKFCGVCGAPNVATNNTNATAVEIAPRKSGNNKPEIIEFITSIPTFYMKGKVEIAQDHVRLSVPNTVLGLIPCGSRGGTYDVNHIASVHTDSKLNLKRLLLGALLALVGFSSFGSADSFVLALILSLLGALLVLNAFENDVIVTLDSSLVIDIPLVVFEKAKAELIEQKILAIVHARTYDTNTRIHATNAANTVVAANTANADRIVDAIAAK